MFLVQLSLMFAALQSFAQSGPTLDEITIAPGRSVSLEVLRPTRVTCSLPTGHPAYNRCEFQSMQSGGEGTYQGKVALYVNGWRVTPVLDLRAALVEYNAMKEAGLCP